MNQIYGRLLILAFLSGLWSCNIINPVEPVPAYLHISSFDFVHTPGKNTGTLSNKITDAWIYINNEPIGVFEIPFTVPVLKEGSYSVKIRAGVMQNGIAATRIVYPFFSEFDTIINFSPQQTFSIRPVFSYQEAAKFSLLEDFEGTGLLLERSSSSDTILYHIKNVPDVFEGTGSGKGIMDDTKNLFEVVSVNFLQLPRNQDVYLELNYKSELAFSCGVYANEPQQVNQYSSGLSINPSANWNKIYVEMATAIGSSSNASGYKLYIGALKTLDGTAKSLHIDNVKVVHW